MIDVLNRADLLTFRELADSLPRTDSGAKIAVSSLVRWATLGRRGVKLDASRVGRTWYTTREAACRFFAAGSAPAPIQPAAMSPAAVRASRRADALGL